MNREIRFRAWDNKNKYMVDASYGNWISFDGVPYEEADRKYDTPNIEIEVSRDLILMQSTGTYDKNKKEIYEGDVIKLVNEDNETIRVLCEFGTARRNINGNLVDITGFYFKLESGFKSFPIVENYLGKHDLELFEIIGNVYETPELFKLKKNERNNSVT